MTKHPFHKPFYILLISLSLLTSCNSQTKAQPQAQIFWQQIGQPKLVKTQGSNVSDNVHGIVQDKYGNLWFATTGEGVYVYDGKLFRQFTTTHGMNSNTIWCILEDKEGKIWIGKDAGVCVYNGKTFTHLSQ
jgi:ligand-binding sensor domain-containing protein